MRAAIVDRFTDPPRLGEFPSEPEPLDGEVLVQVRAAALSNLVRGQASGRHYSSGKQLPLIPGNDGVGTLPDGRRVYFYFPRAPFGSMAERTVVPQARTIPVPDSLDDVTAAALANPGIASWAALIARAHFQPGQTVLINGATGTAGQQAVQAARALGAKRILATGRNPAGLQEAIKLGATDTIAIGDDPETTETNLQSALAEIRVDVVLDYLWGPTALTILKILGGGGALDGEPRVRFVQIGSIAGETIALPAHLLRSSGIELVGSGIGSLSAAEVLSAISLQFQQAAAGALYIQTETVPLRLVAETWMTKESGKRIVFVP